MKRPDGFYWVTWMSVGKEIKSIGRYKEREEDGSRDPYPWSIIGNDDLFRDQDFKKIGPKIEYPSK